MKSATEWSAMIGAKITKQDMYPLMPEEYVVIIKAIQADAHAAGVKEGINIGMAKAANIVWEQDPGIEYKHVAKAILVARDKEGGK